jgi:hypothetical protein
MPFVIVNDPRYSDVVLEETTSLGNYFSRDQVVVNTDTTTGTYPLGTVITRTKALDDSGAWRVVNAGADIVLANEYAILIGDDFEVKTLGASLENGVAKTCIAITREARVKENAIRALPLIAALSANEWRDLKGLLRKNAGIRVEASNPTV